MVNSGSCMRRCGVGDLRASDLALPYVRRVGRRGRLVGRVQAKPDRIPVSLEGGAPRVAVGAATRGHRRVPLQ